MKLPTIVRFVCFSFLLWLVCIVPSAPLQAQNSIPITIRFDGMEALFFGESSRVSLGIVNAPNHTPQLTVTRQGRGGTVTIAEWRTEELRGLFEVLVDGSPSEPSRYQTDQWQTDTHDLHWLVNMNELYLDKKLTIVEDRLWSKVHFYTGEFYADRLSDKPARFFAADRSGKVLAFNRKIAEPAAKIQIYPGQALVMRGNGKVLRVEYAPGVSYDVQFTNLPPKEMASFDHFLHYYDIIQEPLPHYTPVMAFDAATPYPHFCSAVIFGENKLTIP